MAFKNIPLKVKIASGLAILVIVAVVIAVPIAVTSAKKKESSSDGQKDETTISTAAATTTAATTTTIPPFNPSTLKGNEASRIDCFLEAQSRFENLTKYACEKRNCIYDPDVSHPKVPKCYFDRENLGYKLKEKIDANKFHLIQSGKAPFFGVINDIQLNVEYYGNNIIRVKVRIIIGSLSRLFL